MLFKKPAFTLLECLIALSLTMILFMISVMGYRHFITENTLIANVNQMVEALRFARMSAITSHHRVVLLPASANDWQAGQVILDQANGNVLRVLPAIVKPYAFSWKSTLDYSDSLTWRRDGMTFGQQGSFYFCNANSPNHSAEIIILRTGRLRSIVGNIAGCQKFSANKKFSSLADLER